VVFLILKHVKINGWFIEIKWIIWYSLTKIVRIVFDFENGRLRVNKVAPMLIM
jgi:hypothetical protein